MPFLAFLVAVTDVPGLLSGAAMPRWWVIALGLPLVSRLDPRALQPAVAMLLLLGLGYCATLLVPGWHGGTLQLGFILILCGVMVAAAALPTLDRVMAALAVGVGISSFVCVLQFLFGWSPVDQGVAPAGLFYNRLVLAETAAPLFVWCVLVRRWDLAILMAIPLALCDSRIALLEVGVGLLYGARIHRLVKAVAVSWVVVLAVASVVLVGFDKFHSAGERLVLWGATVMSVTPLGHGLGWFYSTHNAEEFAHSDVLQSLAEMGIGAFLFLAIPCMIFAGKRGTHAERAAFLALCVGACVGFPLHLPTTAFMAAVLAGYLAGDRSVLCVDGLYRRDPHGARGFYTPGMAG